MGREKKLTIQDLNPGSTATEEVSSTALYWLGMLPADKPFKIKRPTREKSSDTNDYFTYAEVTSQELWEGEVNQWVGKCPWKQSLSVNSMSFHAFTETLMRSVGAGAGILNKVSWPGAVVELDDERAAYIIAQCYRNVIRIEGGRGKDISIDQPKSYMMLDNGTERVTKESYNPKTDTFFAHYVYFVKLEANPQEYSTDTYYRLASSWDEFFKSPPASVAQMYPPQRVEPKKTEAGTK